MPIQLAKLLQSIWTVAMGGFLGLAGGLVLAVILAFRGARELSAAPGIEPYADPRFAAHGPEAVAGFIGQKLFFIGGAAALALLAVAVLSLMLHRALLCGRPCTGSPRAGRVRLFAVMGTLVFMGIAAAIVLAINDRWPGLYDTAAGTEALADRRAAFDRLHQWSERVVTIAWLCGLVALGVSPWCRQPTGGSVGRDG